jgi:hypothetical protein
MPNSRYKFYLLCLLFAITFTDLNAQLNATTAGNAVDLGGNCYRITAPVNDQVGGVWYDNAINFA